MKTQYDSIAPSYHKHMTQHKASVKDDFISIVGLDKMPISLLEYGCGSGIDANYFLETYPNIHSYHGIDNSQSMLGEFKKNVKNTKASVELADIDTYMPKKESFDLVYAMYSIHYTNDLLTLLKRINSSLKTGGYLGFRDAHPLVGFFRKKSKKYDVKENVDFPVAGGGSGLLVNHPTFTFEEYVNYSHEAGFQIIKLTENMGSQSKVIGINGFEIPTTMTLILRKDTDTHDNN